MENQREILKKISNLVDNKPLNILKKAVQTSPSAAFIESIQQIEDNSAKQQILSSLMELIQRGVDREKAAESLLNTVYQVLERQQVTQVSTGIEEPVVPTEVTKTPRQTMDVSVLTTGDDEISRMFNKIYPTNELAAQLEQFKDLNPNDWNKLSFEVYTSGRMKNDSKQEESGVLEMVSQQGREFLQSRLAQDISSKAARLVDDRQKDSLSTAIIQAFSPNLVLALDKQRGYFIQDRIDKRLHFFLKNPHILNRYNIDILRPINKDLAQELSRSGVDLTKLFGGPGGNTKTNEFKKAYEVVARYAVDTPEHIGLFSYISQLITQEDESIPRWIKHVAGRIYSEEFGRESKPFEIGKGEGEKEMERTDFIQPGEQRGESLDALKREIAVQKSRLAEVDKLNDRLVEIFNRVETIAANVAAGLRSRKYAKPFPADLIEQSVKVAQARIAKLVTSNNLKKRKIQQLTEQEPTTLEDAKRMMRELYQETEEEKKDLSSFNELLEFGNKTGRILRYEFSPEEGEKKIVKNFRSLAYQNDVIAIMDQVGRQKMAMINKVKERLRQNGNSVEEAATFLGINVEDAAMYGLATPKDIDLLRNRYLDLNDDEIKALMVEQGINIPFDKAKTKVKNTHYRHINQTAKDGVGGWMPLLVSQLEDNLDPIGRQAVRAFLAMTDVHSDVKKGGVGRMKGGKMTYKFKPADAALYYLLSKGDIPPEIEANIEATQKITPEQSQLIEKVRDLLKQSFFVLVDRILKLGELSDSLQKLASNDVIFKRVRQLICDFQEDYDVYKRML